MLNSPQPLHCCCCCCVRATCLSLASRAASLTSGPAPSTSRARRWLSRSTAPRRSSPQPEQMPWLLLLPEQTLRSLLNSVADIGRSARVEVLRQTQQVPLQHRNRHLIHTSRVRSTSTPRDSTEATRNSAVDPVNTIPHFLNESCAAQQRCGWHEKQQLCSGETGVGECSVGREGGSGRSPCRQAGRT